MMYVKVKAKDVRFTIPIPYVILNITISIVSSKFFQRNINKWTKEYFTFPLVDKRALKSVVKELKSYKGIVLVDVKDKDGTEVKIKL